MDQGTAGNGRKNAVRLWGNHLAVPRHKEKIGSAGFLHLGTCAGIKIHILIKPVGMGRHDGMQAHGIVQTCLDIAGSARRRTVKIADTDGQRLYTAFEIRSHGSTEDTELIHIRRLYADDGIHAEHIRADIQRRPASIGRHIRRIGGHSLRHCIHEMLFREHRHLKASGGILHPLPVQIGTECHDMPVLGSIRLQSLKDRLGILQHARTLIQYNIGIFDKGSLVPTAVFKIGDISFLRLNISKIKIAPINVFLFHCRYLLSVYAFFLTIIILFTAKVNRNCPKLSHIYRRYRQCRNRSAHRCPPSCARPDPGPGPASMCLPHTACRSG